MRSKADEETVTLSALDAEPKSPVVPGVRDKKKGEVAGPRQGCALRLGNRGSTERLYEFGQGCVI